MILPQIERYWAKVEVNGDEDCWPWVGAKTKAGYGIISVTIAKGRRQLVAATHIALFLAGYPKPRGKDLVMHACDNPPCVNPGHLRWGTYSENTAEMVFKRRGAWAAIQDAKAKVAAEKEAAAAAEMDTAAANLASPIRAGRWKV